MQDPLESPRMQAPQRKEAPVFVLGCPRSGTTLLYDMLLSAGGFAVYCTESNVFNLLRPRFGNLRSQRNKRKLMDVWLRSKLFDCSGLDAASIRSKILSECKDEGDFLRILMEEIAHRQNVSRWADNTPTHLLYMPEIKRAFPNALVIHMIRDGRDVALSLSKKQWLRPHWWRMRSKLLVGGLYWGWMVSKGRGHGRRIGADYLEIHFEDLIRKPRETLNTLSRFIDHDLDYDRIQHVGIGTVSRPNTSFRKQRPNEDFDPVERWKGHFSPEELGAFEAKVGKTLEENGYALATSGRERLHPLVSRGVRAFYDSYFDSKLWVKNNGSMYFTQNLPLFDAYS